MFRLYSSIPPIPEKRVLRACWIGFVGALLGLVARGPEASPQAKFEPASGCYIGAFVLKDAHIGGDMSQFERLTGKPHASFFTYVGYGQPFPSEWVEEVKAQGAAPHVAFEPNQGLAEIQDNDYLQEWAYAARRAQCPLFLRFASEMNGTWQNYGGDPALYIRKWRLVHDVLEKIAPNVALVWAPYCTPIRPIPSYYPGDEYVDWVGVNLYSVHHHNNDINQPSDQEDPRELLRFVYDHYSDRKPIMICEYAATHFCLACERATVGFALEKMEQLYRSLPTEFPRVKMINWFNWDTIQDGAAANNYALTDDSRVLKLYRELIHSSYFLSQVPGPLAPVRVTSPHPRTARNVEAPEAIKYKPEKIELRDFVDGREVTGRILLRARMAPELQVQFVFFQIDQEVVTITNCRPYEYLWNTARFVAGEHALQVVAVGPDGREEKSAPVKVTVRHE